MSNKKSYVVCMSVDGYVEVEVKAESPEEASKVACDKVGGFDFGPLKSVEWNTLNVSDEDGNEIDAEDL